jgi:hypothetical protein
MIAFANQPAPKPHNDAWHAGFLAMLPQILSAARFSFRHFHSDAREEAIQEVVANAAVACERLHSLGKADLAYPSVLARYGIAKTRAGYKTGSQLNCHDVHSRYARLKKGFKVESLQRLNPRTGTWAELLVEDRRTPPPDQAAFRIDFPAWLARRSRRDRRVAASLARGDRTQEVAHRFGLSPARISQLRRELEHSWREFHGEIASPRREVRAACCC